MTVLALVTMAALWDNCTGLSPMAAPTATATPEQAITDSQERNVPWPNLLKPSLRGPATFPQAGDSGHLPPQHLPAFGFSLLGVPLLFVLPRVSQSLSFFCAICLSADPILLPTPLVGAWASPWCPPLAEQCYCQGPTMVGFWQLLSPGQRGLAAGWRWPRSALLSSASTSNRG